MIPDYDILPMDIGTAYEDLDTDSSESLLREAHTFIHVTWII